MIWLFVFVFFVKQKTAYEMRISDWSSDVCSSDLLARKLIRTKQVRKIPVVLTMAEVKRLLDATRCLKHQAALSVAYGAGLRVAEVSALKVTDIDSKRMLLRIERGKGGRYRNAMLPEGLLLLLRDWWRAGRQQGRSEEHTSELQSLMRISYA